MSPTILRTGGYRFFFFSNEGQEPPHIHVQRDRSLAKFWLETGELASSTGFRPHELNRIKKLLMEHRKSFLEAWDEYFSR